MSAIEWRQGMLVDVIPLLESGIALGRHRLVVRYVSRDHTTNEWRITFSAPGDWTAVALSSPEAWPVEVANREEIASVLALVRTLLASESDLKGLRIKTPDGWTISFAGEK